MQQILVSIVVPIYNVSKYVERALASIFNQTYKNIEVLIIDDCGTDNSMDIVESFIQTNDINNSFKIIKHTKNRGLSAARNTGTYHAKGDYIYYLDSDDELTYDCIERLVFLANKYKDVDVVVGNMSFKSESGDFICPKRFFTQTTEFIEYNNDIKWITRYIFDYSKNFYIPAVSQNKLYNRKFINTNKLFFIEGLIHEDEKFLFDLSNRINTIAIEYEVTYIRYINPNSIMTSLNLDRSASFWTKIIESSYIEFKEPYIDLKIRYCLSKLKTNLFTVTQSNIAIVKEIKSLLSSLLRFTLKHRLLKGFVYTILLLLLPIKFRQLELVNKVYKYIYKPQFILNIF